MNSPTNLSKNKYSCISLILVLRIYIISSRLLVKLNPWMIIKLAISITVGENIVGALKMWNDYGVIKSLFLLILDSYIVLYSIAPCKVITLNLLSFIFDYYFFALLLYFPFCSYCSSNYRSFSFLEGDINKFSLTARFRTKENNTNN